MGQPGSRADLTGRRSETRPAATGGRVLDQSSASSMQIRGPAINPAQCCFARQGAVRGLGSTAWGSSTRSRSIYAGSQRGFSCGGVDWVLEFPEIPRAAVATPEIAHDPTSGVATGPARRPSSKADPALASETSASIPAARTWPTGAHLSRFSSRQRMPGMDAEFFRTRLAVAHGCAVAGSVLLCAKRGSGRGRRGRSFLLT
jgi:hypothetical protein